MCAFSILLRVEVEKLDFIQEYNPSLNNTLLHLTTKHPKANTQS